MNGAGRDTTRLLTFLVCVGMASPLVTRPARAQNTWTGTSNGNWSDETRWLNGVPPTAGGSFSLALTFRATGTTGYVATNDLGNPFAVNQLVFDSQSAGLVTVASATNNPLRLGGSGAAVRMSGSGSATVSSPIQLAGNTTLGGTGAGNLILSGVISEFGSARSITVTNTSGFYSVDTQLITLSGSNTFSGGITLSGNLVVEHSNALGTGTLTVNGGSFRAGGSIGSGLSLANPVVLSGGDFLFLDGTATLTGTLTGTGSVSHGVTVQGASLTLTNSASYPGATTVGFRPDRAQPGSGGSLTLSGGSGVISNSTAVNVVGGQLNLLNGGSAVSDRLPDTAAVNLVSGLLTLEGGLSGTAPLTEKVGSLNVSGHSNVTVTRTGFLGNGAAVELRAQQLSRVDRGTVFFAGTELGGSGTASKVTFVTDPSTDLVGGGGAAGSTTVSILPYATGEALANQVAVRTLVTYTPSGGVRPLDPATEYVSGFGSAAAASNVRLTASAVISTATTVNALATQPNNFLTLSGAGSLTLNSGVLLLNNPGGCRVSVPIQFGGREAQITNVGLDDGPANNSDTIDKPLIGTNGLTKSGPGVLVLTGDNTNLSGRLTINSGSVVFADPAQLPGTGAITLNGTATNVGNSGVAIGQLRYVGATPVSLPRTLNLRGLSEINLRPSGGGRLTLASGISGDGTLLVTSTTGATLAVSGSSSHTGGLVVRQATLLANNTNAPDSALGSQSVVVGGDLTGSATLGGGGRITGPVTVAAGGIISPGSPELAGGIGTLTLAGPTAVHQFRAGGRYVWQVSAVPAMGSAGTNWDFLPSEGKLLVSANAASAASRFTVRVEALGAVAGFNSTQPQSWTIAQFAGGVDAVPSDAFTVESSNWTGANDLGGGTLLVGVDGDAIKVYFIPVPEPAHVLGGACLVGVLVTRLRRIRRPGDR